MIARTTAVEFGGFELRHSQECQESCLSPTALGGDVTDPDPGSSCLGSVHLPVRQTQEFLGSIRNRR